MFPEPPGHDTGTTVSPDGTTDGIEDWDVTIPLAGGIPLGLAVETSGSVDLPADGILDASGR